MSVVCKNFFTLLQQISALITIKMMGEFEEIYKELSKSISIMSSSSSLLLMNVEDILGFG